MGRGSRSGRLGEIVKAHAGILESDDPATATAKLDVVLPEGEERAWFRQRLLPLLGIEASTSAEREELFTAWRRWLELIAEDDPTVLVFEDLHWADDALLAFLEHLAGRAEGVPLMIVGTTRPELYEQHADFGNGLRNANSINLAPLSSEETARLVLALLDASVIPAELQQPILDRAGGNPLYAEEFVRLLKDRDLLVRKGSSWELREGAEVPFPDSVRALIAARLDTLTPDAKSLLADAAVIGKVFWAGAVAAMGDRDPDVVVDTLRELSRKELVRPARRSSMQGEAEYAFWHILTRDVAYNQLPRASAPRATSPPLRGSNRKAPERVEDLADVLAYHYATALDLARAAGHADQAATLEAPARRFLTLAGERALGLDTAAAHHQPRAGARAHPRGPPRPAQRARPLRRGRPSRRRAATRRRRWRRRSPPSTPRRSPRQAHAMRRLSGCSSTRGSALGGAPGRGARTARTTAAWIRAGRSAQRVARTEMLQGRTESAITRRSSAQRSRASSVFTARRGARLPRLVAHGHRRLRRSSRICARRSCSRIRPDRAARSQPAQQPRRRSCGLSGPPGRARPSSPPASRMPPPRAHRDGRMGDRKHAQPALRTAGQTRRSRSPAHAHPTRSISDKSSGRRFERGEARIHTLRGQPALAADYWTGWKQPLATAGTAEMLGLRAGTSRHHPRRPSETPHTPPHCSPNSQRPQAPATTLVVRRTAAGARQNGGRDQ